jgi:hypothetical protein
MAHPAIAAIKRNLFLPLGPDFLLGVVLALRAILAISPAASAVLRGYNLSICFY